MAKPLPYLEEIGVITKALEKIGLTPVLVGGMALVILGSRRVTRDFDFLIPSPGSKIDEMLDIFYSRGFELATRVSKEGEIIATLDNERVAAARLRLDNPKSVYFLHQKTGLRIDLLFDFPIPAAQLIPRARKIRIRSHPLRIAAREDLLHLKKLAHAGRTLAADAEDLAFLRQKRKK